MKHTYHISGMSYDGYRKKVEEVLNSIAGVKAVVTLDPSEAIITMDYR